MKGQIITRVLLVCSLIAFALADTNSTVNLSQNATFTPAGAWSQIDPPPSCDFVQAGGQDFFTNTTSAQVTMQIPGVAVYVYGVRTNTTGVLNFKLDDTAQPDQGFAPSTSCALLFTQSGLTNTVHNLTISLVSAVQSGNLSSTARLDITEVVYTTTNTPATEPGGATPTKKKSVTGPVVGGVVGGFAAIAVLFGLFLYNARRRRHTYVLRRSTAIDEPEPAASVIEPKSPALKMEPYTMGSEPSEMGDGSDAVSTTVASDVDYRQPIRRGSSVASSAFSEKRRPLSPQSPTAGRLSPHAESDIDYDALAERLASRIAIVQQGVASSTDVAGPSNFLEAEGSMAPPPEYQERDLHSSTQQDEEPSVRAPSQRKN